MSKVRVILLFGGRSAEHEVSIRSARSVYQNLDPARYEILPVAIDAHGAWHYHPDFEALSKDAKLHLEGATPVTLLADPTRKGLHALGESIAPLKGGEVDVIFPVLHGPKGEDGTIQGLFDLAEIPYVGCGVLASSTGMDKDAMKRLYRDSRIPLVPSLTLYRRDLNHQADLLVKKCIADLGEHLFIKPANMGSSVGVTQAKGATQILKGLKLAAKFDRKIIVEKAMDIREIELAALGLAERVEISVPGEITSAGTFYSFDDKYVKSTSTTQIPADLDEKTTQELQRLARLAFQAIDGSGLTRIDFFIEKESGEIYLNEVNTLPGFTSISMYPMLWEASGVPYARLLDRLIDLAFERHRERQANQNSRR